MKTAIIQMNSRGDKAANLDTAERLIDLAVADGSRVIALPENFPYLGQNGTYLASAEPIPGPTTDRLAEKARQHRVYLLCGSIQESSGRSDRCYNTSVLLNPEGEIIAKYRKIHLFDVEFSGSKPVRESDSNQPGADIVTAQIDGITVGLTICYDLRFPELYRILALRGAHLIFVPAAFTMHTGKDHWEVLLRARAIENQLFIVAPAQVGKHLPDDLCYGRAMIVDPWGIPLVVAPDTETFVAADLDLEFCGKVRRQLPSLANRRPEAYQWPADEIAVNQER
ncbi:MAG: carbon-nitrogen hydrolase family protein [Chloroflexi bacterium]|nr:carbon-nitrogen hydrolase family protein [Chloroflexota bacterium]